MAIFDLNLENRAKWYKKISEDVKFSQINKKLPFNTLNLDLIELSYTEISGLISLFPQNAKERSLVKNIICDKTYWIDKTTKGKNLEKTDNQIKAISRTSIIPSDLEFDYEKDCENIYLYQIPDGVYRDKNIRKIISAHALIYEFSQSIINYCYRDKKNKLLFQEVGVIKGLDAINNFAKLSEKYSPISNYSSNFWKNGALKSMSAMNVEFSEAITAYILGIGYINENVKKQDAYLGKEEIKEYVKSFLKAKKIN